MIFAGDDDSSYLGSGAVFSGHAVDVCFGGEAQEGRHGRREGDKLEDANAIHKHAHVGSRDSGVPVGCSALSQASKTLASTRAVRRLR